MQFWSSLWSRWTRPRPPADGNAETFSWRSRLRTLAEQPGTTLARAYLRANRQAVRGALEGYGPDDANPSLSAGARMVANISAAHIPAFCAAAAQGDPKPYKNYYDLGKHQLGETPTRREVVDQALPVADYKSICFCAAELNGAGVRFYGDFCLVLKPAARHAGATILERNSYDLVREPLRAVVEHETSSTEQFSKRKELASAMAGSWECDLPDMVALKMSGDQRLQARRLTTGQIAQGVLDDEDYMEVLHEGSFGPKDLQEVRLSVSDAALETHIVDQARRGQSPTLEEILWCRRRQEAVRALSDAGVGVRVITMLGRTRT